MLKEPRGKDRWVVVDVEADGPIPGDYSMVCFGAVVVEGDLSTTFYGKTEPISDLWVPEALAVSGFSREQHKEFDDPAEVMSEFTKWLKEVVAGRPKFISDNNGFDWQFINWYFHHFEGRNPMGFSSMNLNGIYKGLNRHIGANWKRDKRMRQFLKTRHDHMPVNDAKRMAEAMQGFEKLGFRW